MCCCCFGCPSGCCSFPTSKTSLFAIIVGVLTLITMIIFGVLGVVYSRNIEKDFNRVRCSLYLFFDDTI